MILEKKETGRPITSEDYIVLDRLVREIEGRIIAQRAESHAEIRRMRAEMRRQIPEVAWLLPLDALDLPGRIHNLLLDNELEKVGDVLLLMEIDDQKFLEFRGFGEKMLETLKEYVDAYEMPDLESMMTEEQLAAVAEEGLKVEEAVEAEVEAEAEADADAVEDLDIEAAEAVEEAEAADTEPVEEEVVLTEEEFAAAIEETLEKADSGELFEEEVEAADAESVEEEEVPDIDDLSRSIVDLEPQKPEKTKGKIVVVSPIQEEDDKSDSRRGKSYVYDEEVGEVVVKRKRKGSRRRPEWEEFEDDLE
jgi:hypothetical protein